MSSMHTKAGEKLVIVVVGSESGNRAMASGGGSGGFVTEQEERPTQPNTAIRLKRYRRLGLRNSPSFSARLTIISG